eukprot:MONOS_6328.1-p1 / transcript=MONOS_6328.1 / gene=MONOS_6328 / organism=Monocercomonoides_exilis_PA203 / gene_product=unspecified product / transcript_product=unspecified product / location=Mono_scaffold00198:30-5202(-) / protein_length=1690 / sequence_SO=supercontig / SO=protein_coding / is_pseudo=false
MNFIIYGHCFHEDATNDKIGIIRDLNILQIIPADASIASMETENSSNTKKTHIQVQYNENKPEYYEPVEWKGKWRKNQNNRIEFPNTNTNRNVDLIEGDAQNVYVRNRKRIWTSLEESKVMSHVILSNSSLSCANLDLIGNGNTSSITLSIKSVAMVIGCRFEVRNGISPFDLCGSRLLLANLTLRFWNSQQTQMPPLFSTKLSDLKSQSSNFVSIFSSEFSSFQTSSPPFLSSSNVETPTHRFVTSSLRCGSNTLINDCSFSSVCDVYDGGIVPSINNPFASLTVSNTSFIECRRARNAVINGTAEVPFKPGRQNITDNGANIFTWCEWNGSSTTGKSDSSTDKLSNGGAICMVNLGNRELSVSHCSFNECVAHSRGGGIMCHSVKSAHIEYNTFNSCTAQNHFGGGMYVVTISKCVRISRCEFKSCKATSNGGGINLDNFQVSATNCIESENGGGESACVFDCRFISCSVVNDNGGGLSCRNIPSEFKMRSIQFISCNASSYGGGLLLDPQMETVSSNSHYCHFIFFHNCNCTSSTPYGHDVYFEDDNNLFSSSNPFYESYTTNTNDERVCYNGSSLQMTEKKWWLKEGPKNRFVGENGDDTRSLCGMSEAVPCKTVEFVVFVSLMQSSSTITVLSGKHQSEISTIDIGDKIISVVGNGREESLIGTKSLSVSSTTLFSVKSGQLNVQHLGIDHNTTRSSSPSVFVVSSGSGTLSLEDVLINSSISEESVISSSVFVMALSQLRMSDVEIKNMKISQQLFVEPSSAGSTSGERMLVNVTVRNVNRTTEGNGVVVEKSIKGGEKFSVQNVSIENCVCEEGNGGGICVCLTDNGEVVMNGMSVIDGCVAVGIEGNGGRGGGMFVEMESGGCGLTIGENIEFSKVIENNATYGKDVFVSCGSGVFLESKVNTSSFAFFTPLSIPSDVLKLSGSDNGDENEVIPLFVYLCTMGTKVIVDGSGGNGMDHNHCGFEAFRCQTVDYCANSRLSSTVNEIEVISPSSITKEITVPSFGVLISGRIVSSDGERMGVNVSDGGSDTQDWLVGCSSSLTMSRLSFVVKGQLNSRRSAFIHSTSSTLSVTNCSVSFESGALTDGKIGYSIIEMAGGNLIVDGFVMESGVTLKMNRKSPITMTSGVKLEILNSRMNGVEVDMAGGNGGGGCLNVGMGVNGNVKIEESNISSRCSGGSGMKGGGMMISIGSEGRCEVPSEDSSEKKGGLGGGIFAELPEELGSFVMEGMTFEGCEAWKGRNVFVSGWDLREIVNKEHFKWEMSEGELKSLDELCGWERKMTGEERYVIPLVVYLWDNWSGDGFVSKEKGGDFSGCGHSEAPCSSIDYLKSLRYSTLGEGESHIKIVRSGLLQKSMSLLSSSLTIPIVSVEGEREGTDLKVSEGGRNEGEGEGGGMIASNIIVSFTNLSFCLPNELGRYSSLIQSFSTSSATLSVVRCSFICEDETMKVNYCLIKADGGSVAIEDCTLSQFLLAKGFVEFTTDVNTVDVMNMSISNITISESSLMSLSQSSTANMLINNAMENTKQTVKVNCSSFTNITCFDNRACVMSAGSFSAGMECVVEGCIMTKCMSEKSVEGGGMKMLLKRGVSELKVSGCSLGMCVCSTGKGRGGGMMIDALDPNEKNTNTEMLPIGLRLENIRFMMNDAFVGKDVFIRCDSIDSQLNERLFELDFDQEALKGKDSI